MRLVSPRAWSIRWRLTAWYIAAVLVILCTGGVIAYYGFRATLIANTDRSLTIKAAELVSLISGGERLKPERNYDTPPPNSSNIEAKAKTAFAAPNFDNSGDMLYMRLVKTGDGLEAIDSPNILPHSFIEGVFRQTPVKPVNSSYFLSSGTGNELRAVQVVVPRSPYAVQISTPWERNEASLFPVAQIIATVIALFVVLSAFGGWILVGRTLRPIDDIVTEAEKTQGNQLRPEFVATKTFGNDEIGHLVQALNAMMGRVHRVLESQRQFTADASHDLRTPLSILRGEIELALARSRSVDEYKATLNSCLEETDRLTRIVTDLSDLAYADYADFARSENPKVAVKISELCVGIARSRRLQAELKQVDLHIDIDTEIEDATILADVLSLERAISNLVDNAIKYNRFGGGVWIRVARTGEWVQISVKDTGIGISDDDCARIFDRFYRADKARTAGYDEVSGSSSGLGLAIVKTVVTSLGGNCTIHSELGSGSEFTIRLPINNSNMGDVSASKPPHESTPLQLQASSAPH